MSNYILANSFGSANIADKTWYVMEATDLVTLASEQNVQFGDKAYVIKDKTFHIYGNDDTWYEM